MKGVTTTIQIQLIQLSSEMGIWNDKTSELINKPDTFIIQEPIMESNDLFLGAIESHFIQF